ncbi:MAG: hypothetical protein MUE49_02800 [Rhodospirillales bacterium]|nr:hypothetical protein [Rhodospirillales bacterium]
MAPARVNSRPAADPDRRRGAGGLARAAPAMRIAVGDRKSSREFHASEIIV